MAGRIIINHWDAGIAKPIATDFEHYHIIIDQSANVYKGEHPIEANDNTSDGDYAAHAGGGNTRSWGISLCGMLDFSLNTKITKFPLTKVQLEKLFEINAKVSYSEGYEKVSSDILMTHMEFGISHPKTSSAGKIDICYLPPYPNLSSTKVGDFIRSKTQWYLDKIVKGEIKPEIIFVNVK
jgi:hypothetical protein